MTDMRELPFGVEIEMTGITREQAAKALAQLWSTSARHTGGTYDAWSVDDPEGKTWKLMSDGSIDKEQWTGGDHYEPTRDARYSVELVTPVLA